MEAAEKLCRPSGQHAHIADGIRRLICSTLRGTGARAPKPIASSLLLHTGGSSLLPSTTGRLAFGHMSVYWGRWADQAVATALRPCIK